MHLGHYFGTMHSWKTIQDAGVETWILVADYQVITDRDGVGPIRERVLSLVTDALAVGVDPQRSTIFAHSAVPAQNQLMLPFLSLVTESELHRNPTVKSELEATDGRGARGPPRGFLLDSEGMGNCRGVNSGGSFMVRTGA